MSYKYLFSILLLEFTFFFGNSFVYGQYQDSLLQNKKVIDSILQSEHLNKLPGNPETFYSNNYNIRATTLQQLVFNCSKFYEKAFPKFLFSLSIYVLDKSDWDKPPFGAPYGLPDYLPDNKLEIIGADKNALAHISGKPDDPIKSDSTVSGYDYVAIHELGHYFFVTLHNLTTEKWFDEFLANYFLICYVYGNNIDFDIKQFFMPGRNQLHKTLEDFNKFYDSVGPVNYDWYQKEFIQLGVKLYPQLKLKLIRYVIENYSVNGKHLNALTLLKKLNSTITNNWLKEMQ